jgi:lysophospholipase L1-like esterase
MRFGAWAWLVALPACQLVAGITDVSSNGPCSDDRECPRSESCVDGHCQTKSTSGGAGSGAQAGTAGTSAEAGAGQTNVGGSSGIGGSNASGGASGTSQAGATVAQGGDDGAGRSGDGGSVSGHGGDGETSGAGAVGGAASGGAGSGGVTGGGAGSGGTSGAGAGGNAANGGGGMTAGSSGSSGMAGTVGTGPVRIMPLGDGITATTCMRAFLWQKLSDSDYPEFDFVGSRLTTYTCDPADYDNDHEGHSGYRVSDVLSETPQNEGPSDDPYTGSSGDLDTWFNDRPADIVLMLLGSNDFLRTDYTADDVKGAYSKILTKLRSINSRVTLLVGLLPPMRSTQCDTDCESRRSTLNSTLPNWASSVSTAVSHVDYVDLSGMSVEDTDDGVKPNDAGAEFLANKWYEAIVALP